MTTAGRDGFLDGLRGSDYGAGAAWRDGAGARNPCGDDDAGRSSGDVGVRDKVSGVGMFCSSLISRFTPFPAFLALNRLLHLPGKMVLSKLLIAASLRSGTVFCW
mgnify:CR=1 FL=1